jgi:hypothetical protein
VAPVWLYGLAGEVERGARVRGIHDWIIVTPRTLASRMEGTIIQ